MPCVNYRLIGDVFIESIFPKGLNAFALNLPYRQRNKGNHPKTDFLKNSTINSYSDMAFCIHVYAEGLENI